MPETTPNLGLQAPLGTEPVSQGDDLMRANNTILDTEIAGLQASAAHGFDATITLTGGIGSLDISAAGFASVTAATVIRGTDSLPGFHYVVSAGNITTASVTVYAVDLAGTPFAGNLRVLATVVGAK
jgi:hypothetical protein